MPKRSSGGKNRKGQKGLGVNGFYCWFPGFLLVFAWLFVVFETFWLCLVVYPLQQRNTSGTRLGSTKKKSEVHFRRPYLQVFQKIEALVIMLQRSVLSGGQYVLKQPKTSENQPSTTPQAVTPAGQTLFLFPFWEGCPIGPLESLGGPATHKNSSKSATPTPLISHFSCSAIISTYTLDL